MQRHPDERADRHDEARFVAAPACPAFAGARAPDGWRAAALPHDYGEWRDATRCDPGFARDVQRAAGMHRGYAGSARAELPHDAVDFHPPPRAHDEARGFRGVGPRGYRRSDLRIHEAVSETLREAGDVDATDVEVEVVQGEVTLSGSVPTRAMKRAAERWVEDVPDVGDVINRLRVESGRALRTEPGQEPDEVLDARGVRLLRP